jgi:hypothetical protein
MNFFTVNAETGNTVTHCAEFVFTSFLSGMADIITDFIFGCGTRTAVRSLTDAGVDTYLYYNK